MSESWDAGTDRARFGVSCFTKVSCIINFRDIFLFVRLLGILLVFIFSFSPYPFQSPLILSLATAMSTIVVGRLLLSVSWRSC